MNETLIEVLKTIQDQFSRELTVDEFKSMLELGAKMNVETSIDVKYAWWKSCERRQVLGLSFDEFKEYLKNN